MAPDAIQPFLLGAGAIRGRLVRLGPALDALIGGHDYPSEVAERLGETVILAAGFAGALKYEEIFTLQIQAEGAIPLIVADVTSGGDLRAYARVNPEKLAAAPDLPPVPRLFGKGYLAFTVDQGPEVPRSQGIVDLVGDELIQSAGRYFEQSEQIETALVMAVEPPPDGAATGWRGGALVIQRMPIGGGSPILLADEAREQWNRTSILLSTLNESELLDFALSPRRLLYRLFHEDGVVAYESRPLQAKCRCSEARVRSTLASFPRAEIEAMREDNGDVAVTCEFCKTRYVYTPADLDRLFAIARQ